MKILFFIILTCFLFVVQSVLFPLLPWFNQFFDILIIEILFLSIISESRSMVLAIILIGAVMDSISGVPFFYHILSYLWIYLIVNLGKQIFFSRSFVFVFTMSIVSIVIQHALYLLSVISSPANTDSVDFGSEILIEQVFWGVIFIPAGLVIVNIFWLKWQYHSSLIKVRFLSRDRS